jgi:hypothetical protein
MGYEASSCPLHGKIGCLMTFETLAREVMVFDGANAQGMMTFWRAIATERVNFDAKAILGDKMILWEGTTIEKATVDAGENTVWKAGRAVRFPIVHRYR